MTMAGGRAVLLHCATKGKSKYTVCRRSTKPLASAANPVNVWREIRQMEKVPMTADGASALREELNRLKSTERPRIVQALEEG